MPTNILMPALSPTMTEGTLSRWLKQEGEQVRAGDVIAEIETDKATMEVEAVDEGVLGRILVPGGTAGVKVNAPIAVLVGEGEEVPEEPATAAPPIAAGPEPERTELAPTPPAATPPATPPAEPDGSRIFASPLARRIAQQSGIDLSHLRGTGPYGRIVRADVDATRRAVPPAAESAGAESAAAESATPSLPASAPIAAPHTLVPHSTMRRTVARRLSESKQQIPHFYLTQDVELDALLKLRSELNAKSPADGPAAFKLSVNDLIIKAAALTLRRLPAVNASYTDDGIAQFTDIDISVAVAVPDGLITPIVRRADQKGLAVISAETKDLIARARSGKLKLEEFQGGGFSISNLGMFGVKEFLAVINPPQAAILAIGAGEQRPVVKDGQLAVATVMSCGLSVDHRAIDGALAATWMAAFKQIVEDPLSLML